MTRVVHLDRKDMGNALDVLCDAFHDYPVMKYAFDASSPDYVDKLRVVFEATCESSLTRDVPSTLADLKGGTRDHPLFHHQRNVR